MGGFIELGRGGALAALAGLALATTAGASPTVSSAPAQAAFECSRAQEPPRTEVERTFRSDWLVYDYMGEPTAQEPIADAQTVFTIAPVARDYAGLDAEITVHRHRNTELKNGKAGSAATPQADSIELEKPFIIERRGKTWCYAGRKQCPSRDKSEVLLLAALGGNVELLLPEPGLAGALDAKPSDGTLSIPLSQSLLKRVDLSTKKALEAHQQGTGFPALFSYQTHSDQTVLAISGNSGGKARSGDLTIEVAVDQACRLNRLSVVQDVTIRFGQGKSATRLIHKRTFEMHFGE